MTVSSVPFALQNGSHSASLFRQAVSSVVPNAGGVVAAGDLNVTQTGTPSMGVVVGVGRAWVPGTNVANFSGFTYSSQAMYFALNDASVTLTIAAADPTNPRIDIVCLTVNDSQYTGSTNNAVLQVITGTPAASPTAPTAPANTLVLANVAVAANATSIGNANITQKATAGVVPVQPAVRAASTAVGSATNLLANLQNNAITPIIQAGTQIVTTGSDGAGSFAYPVPFPNGVISITVVNGDHSTGGAEVFSVAGSPYTQSTTTLYMHTSANAVVTRRVNWIAIGW